jgi:cytochrome P450
MTDVAETSAGARPEIPLDINDPEFGAHNYATYDELRSRCPVAWSTENRGFWVLTDYESVFEATRDDDLFMSSNGAGIPTEAKESQVSDKDVMQVMPPIHTDPPLTADMRRLSIKFLSPGEAERLEPEIRAIATELIDEFIERGEADIVRELTTPLPARVILRLLNFDETRWPEWVTIIHTMIHGEDGGMKIADAIDGVRAAIGSEMARRAELGIQGDDMVGSILSGSAGGRELTVQEKFGYILLLLFGGMDTTSGLTGNALVEMSRDPALKQQLIERPELMRSATEEFLRHSTPTQGLARTVTRDTEFHGQQLKEDERVLLLWAAANRDPAVFECPNELDLERNPNRHMAFGVGQHRCLGSNLARSMFRIMVTEILARLPDFTMVDDEPVRFADVGAVFAPRSLPVRFTPGPRSDAPTG